MNELTTISATGPGPLVAIGGAEDKTSASEVLRRILALCGKADPKVGVITTASSIPDVVFEGYDKAFRGLGVTSIADIRIRERAEAEDQRYIDMICDCDIIYISGGDQMRLTSIFGASSALEAIRDRHAAGAMIAGTSAGAASQSTTMVYGGAPDNSLRKGEVKMSAGFGLVDGVIIDTHFLERGRFSRLMEVGASNPEFLGVGLGEDAAVLFHKDILAVFGTGHVIIVDSSDITGSNIFDLAEGEPVAVHGLKMHALVDGYGYHIKDRRVLTPDALGAESLEQLVEYS